MASICIENLIYISMLYSGLGDSWSTLFVATPTFAKELGLLGTYSCPECQSSQNTVPSHSGTQQLMFPALQLDLGDSLALEVSTHIQELHRRIVNTQQNDSLRPSSFNSSSEQLLPGRPCFRCWEYNREVDREQSSPHCVLVVQATRPRQVSPVLFDC